MLELRLPLNDGSYFTFVSIRSTLALINNSLRKSFLFPGTSKIGLERLTTDNADEFLTTLEYLAEQPPMR